MRSKRRGRIFVISAPSGCGKTTLCNKLSKARSINLTQSISATTRHPRRGERQGRDYLFVSKNEFLRRKAKGDFLEWAEVLGHFYGTPRRFVEALLKRGKDVLLSIDVQGAMQIKKRFPDAVLIFILPPSMKTLESRLLGRNTEARREIAKRLGLARRELLFLDKYDYTVVNNKLPEALSSLKSIVKAERCRA